MKRDPAILIVMAMLACGVLLVGAALTQKSSAPTQEEKTAVLMKGRLAHDFALKSLNGQDIRLSDFRGKAILLNFWETSCVPCRIEMPWFVDLQKKYGSQGLQILGVTMDEGADPEDVANFVRDMHIDYPILVGKDVIPNVANDYGGIPFFPETFYIGRDGRIVQKTIGLKSKEEIENAIELALAQQENSI